MRTLKKAPCKRGENIAKSNFDHARVFTVDADIDL